MYVRTLGSTGSARFQNVHEMYGTLSISYEYIYYLLVKESEVQWLSS